MSPKEVSPGEAGRCNQSREHRATAVRSDWRAADWELRGDRKYWRECSIFSWEIQSTFVLMADPLIKLSLSPSGQTICKVKCVTLCITSHRHVLPTRFNVKGGHQYCHIKTIYSFINWQYRVFCSVSLLVLGFYNNSWPVLVGKLVGRLAVICVSV